jgi:hypothetical protein
MRVLLRLMVLIVALAAVAPLARPAQAQEVEYGYLWSLLFDFEQDLNGLLTIQVGPWANGDLLSVDEVSTVRVPCARVGPVYLSGGDAVFDGGYLECTFDLAAVVLRNHGLRIAETDQYGSILLSADLQATAPTVAPIFTHADAAYTIDFTQTSTVRLEQQLSGGPGAQQKEFPGVIGFSRQRYTIAYGCVWLGACNGKFTVGGSVKGTPPGGDRVSFATGPARFLVGGASGATFHGRMGYLLVDPGNTVH